MATSTVENYLKTILQLEEAADQKATVGAIAEELKVTPGTVSVMLKQLSEQGLVKYVPRRHISLLKKGRQQALAVVRRHRLIESFLVKVMDLDWSEVHEEAEELEHVVSDRLLNRMDEMLGHPSHDPHGDPIPSIDGALPTEEPNQSLSKAPAGRYRLVRVNDSDPELLNWLSEHDLQPGAEFTLNDEQRVVGLLELQPTSAKSAPVPLSLATAEHLYGEQIH